MDKINKNKLREIAENQVKPHLFSESNSETETLKLIHELEVHQIELEMQNEELLHAKNSVQLAAKKYLELFDFAPCGYFTVTKDGCIIELNLAAAAILEKERLKLLSSHFGLLLLPESLKTYNQFVENIFNSAQKESCEIVIKTTKGTIKHIQMEGISLEENETFLAVLLDVTHKKNSELELIKAKEKAEESDRLKSAFLANMSHEIRTPMNGILGFSGLLKDPHLTSEEQQNYIQIIEESGNRLLGIINDIIDISKIESNQVLPIINQTDINEQLQFLFTFFKAETDKKNIKLISQITETKGPFFIETDREKVYAILTNLIKNAIKFTEIGRIEFGYKINDLFIEFFVKDTGIGIPKEKQSAIFERFIQADSSDKRAFQGAGLGLAISKAYAEMLGGKIWLESTINMGTTFFFSIPLVRAKPDSKKDENEKSLPLKLIKKWNILIAEDDNASGLLLDKDSAPFSNKITRVSDGRTAIEALKNDPSIDLILMDLKMPEMDGLEATKMIRTFNPSVLIIAQTAFGFEEDKIKALEAGCNDYISKPINKSELEKIILKHT